MRELQIKALPFPATALAQWERGDFDILDSLRPSSYVRRILDEKTRNRSILGRRFFEIFTDLSAAPEAAGNV